MATKHKPQEIVAVIEAADAKATYSQIAAALGVTSRTLRNYKSRWKMVADALEDLKGNRDDFVESKLMDAIDKGNIAAIIFYAKTQMKERGYVERTEVTGVDGGAVQQITRIEIVDNDRDGGQ